MKIGLIVGSLRKDSWNKKVAEATQTLFPEDVITEFIDIIEVPLYNPDTEDEKALQTYKKLRDDVRLYDGYIFFTPEYNRSYAPAIKNVIDIVSHDPEGNSWEKKPAAVFSASIGSMGGMAANHALRQSFIFVDMFAMQQPEVYLGHVHDLFKDGEIIPGAKHLLEHAVLEFVEYAKFFQNRKQK